MLNRYYTTITDGYNKILPIGNSNGYSTLEDVMVFARLYVGGYGVDDFTIWESRPKIKYLKKEGRFYDEETGEVWLTK